MSVTYLISVFVAVSQHLLARRDSGIVVYRKTPNALAELAMRSLAMVVPALRVVRST
ncbi:hypothetical protein [Novipirellula artificiosorum]|uniref:Uncharacterized protein n=1 Tax=Novipirellula artificiosorum TaxID=2528016 RepID=A0A5C6DFS2_9BACT|nr:hypothetical protein [Novipirellula artificiosorum]TWU33829.1 hypothetical protein Poly41_48280 [Novipirellula artificiosorum]